MVEGQRALEGVGMRLFDDVYRGRRVLITGHTGFKGSWLASWLTELGAEVTGFGLPPSTTPNHWNLLRLPVKDIRGDIRDLAAVREAIYTFRPEILFHLAAQPLVRSSYNDPLESWSTNVMGTANVLETCRSAECLCAIVVITTHIEININHTMKMQPLLCLCPDFLFATREKDDIEVLVV